MICSNSGRFGSIVMACCWTRTSSWADRFPSEPWPWWFEWALPSCTYQSESVLLTTWERDKPDNPLGLSCNSLEWWLDTSSRGWPFWWLIWLESITYESLFLLSCSIYYYAAEEKVGAAISPKSSWPPDSALAISVPRSDSAKWSVWYTDCTWLEAIDGPSSSILVSCMTYGMPRNYLYFLVLLPLTCSFSNWKSISLP